MDLGVQEVLKMSPNELRRLSKPPRDADRRAKVDPHRAASFAWALMAGGDQQRTADPKTGHWLLSSTLKVK
jgi:hypothetical protein